MNRITNIYQHKERYGYRRITLELKTLGYTINHKKVKRLMYAMGLYAKTPKTKYKSYRGDRNGTVKNLLLEKVVHKKIIRHITREIFIQQVVMKYGRPTYPNFI